MSLPRSPRSLVAPLSLALTIALAGCGLSPEEEALDRRQAPIINGEACDETTNPTAVALIFEGTMKIPNPPLDIAMRTVMCTGTLIAPDVVLTAAHCVTPELLTGGFGATIEGATYYVSFNAKLDELADPMRGLPPQIGGKPLAELPADAIKAAAFFAHPGFDASRLGADFKGGVNENLQDIGLLFLERALDLATHRPAIVISRDEATQLAVKNEVRIAGWGQQSAAPQNPLVPPAPGSVGVKICATTFINELGTHEMQIGGDIDSSRKCHGDSGGPTYMTVDTTLTNKERLVGITSHAYDQTDCAKGGVDTRVDAWLDWLETELSKRCTDGSRAWCDVPGVIPADYYEPKASPDQGVAAGDGAAEPSTRGCSCRVGGRHDAQQGAMLGGLLLLALFFRRRRRS